MNKEQAKEAMRKGEKLTHPTFTDEEWITEKDSKILTEEGYLHNMVEFWSYRQLPAFDEDWSIIEHELFCSCREPRPSIYPDHKYRCSRCNLVWYK